MLKKIINVFNVYIQLQVLRIKMRYARKCQFRHLYLPEFSSLTVTQVYRGIGIIARLRLKLNITNI